MITLRQYRAEDAIGVLENARQPGLGLTPQATEWSKQKEDRGPAVTAIHSDRIIGCGGIEIPYIGMGEGWCIFVADIQKYAMQVARLLKPTLREMMKEHRLIRVQAQLRTDFPLGIRMAEWMGFREEGTMRKYNPDGTDCVMMAIIGGSEC